MSFNTFRKITQTNGVFTTMYSEDFNNLKEFKHENGKGIMMRFSGVCDKYDVKIYELDLLKINEEIHVVEYDEYECKFFLRNIETNKKEEEGFRYKIGNNSEIIGNLVEDIGVPYKEKELNNFNFRKYFVVEDVESKVTSDGDENLENFGGKGLVALIIQDSSLRDKNNNKVFESDIIKIKNELYIVFYDTYFCMFCLAHAHTNKKIRKIREFLVDDFVDDFEVVGNLTENIDLIMNTKKDN